MEIADIIKELTNIREKIDKIETFIIENYRKKNIIKDTNIILFKGFKLNKKINRLEKNNKIIELVDRECKLIEILTQKNTPVKREEIVRHLNSIKYSKHKNINIRLIDVIIYRINKKVKDKTGEKLIFSKTRFGYYI